MREKAIQAYRTQIKPKQKQEKMNEKNSKKKERFDGDGDGGRMKNKSKHLVKMSNDFLSQFTDWFMYACKQCSQV